MSRSLRTMLVLGVGLVAACGVAGYLLGSATAPSEDEAQTAREEARSAAYAEAFPKARQAAETKAKKRGFAIGRLRGRKAGAAAGATKAAAAVTAAEEQLAAEEAEREAEEEVPLEDLTGPPPPGTTCPPEYVPLSTGECVHYTEYPENEVLPGL